MKKDKKELTEKEIKEAFKKLAEKNKSKEVKK